MQLACHLVYGLDTGKWQLTKNECRKQVHDRACKDDVRGWQGKSHIVQSLARPGKKPGMVKK